MPPELFLVTILLSVPDEFADVAEFATFPAVEIVASFVSSIEPLVVRRPELSMNTGDDTDHDDDVNELVVNKFDLRLPISINSDQNF
jgi:hypothetical protein